jgi:hypothetical protein
MAVNGIGGVATGLTLLVVLVAKFTAGAWITAILVPALIVLMAAVKRHYDGVARELTCDRPMRVENLNEPLIIIPMDRWSRLSEKALRFAMKLSGEVQAVHVDAEDCYEEVRQMWQRNVSEPFHRAGRAAPQLVLVESPYRFILGPLVDYILKVESECPHRQVAVLVPELVVKRWWQAPLHNQRAQVLKLLLLMRGNQRIMVINIPWYL